MPDSDLIPRYPVSAKVNNSQNEGAESATPVTLDTGCQIILPALPAELLFGKAQLASRRREGRAAIVLLVALPLTPIRIRSPGRCWACPFCQNSKSIENCNCLEMLALFGLANAESGELCAP
jgi:hypothetical protein